MSDADRTTVDLVESLSELQALMLSASGVDAFLGDLAGLAAQIVHPTGSCGITLRRDSQPFTVASSDARAEKVDEVQYGRGEGPCLQTLHTGALLDVPDLSVDTRWDGYREHAMAAGVRSSLSMPLSVDGATRGALNIYSTSAHAFGDAERAHAQIFAAQAAAALVITIRNAEQAETSAQLERALASRSVIDQALGVLMAQQRCSADEAFALLRAHSQNNNRKLRDVAAELITRVTGTAPTPGPTFQRVPAGE